MAPRRNATPPPAPEPSPAQAAIINLTTLGLEITFFFMEFVFGLTICKDALRTIYQTIHGQEVPTHNLMYSHMAATILIIAWLLWRHANKIGIHVKTLMSLMGLDTIQFSWFGVQVIVIHTIGAIVMVSIQYFTSRWIYSWVNWYKNDAWDRVMIIEMLVLAPVREEIVFRGLLYAIIYHRIGSAEPKDKARCAVGVGLVFGLVHLLNLFGSRYSPSYIVLQVTLGILIGTFYALRYAHTQSLSETLILHSYNNILSSWLPLDLQLDVTDPMIGFPLLETIIVYLVLITWSWRILRDADPIPYNVEMANANNTITTSNTTTTTATTTTPKSTDTAIETSSNGTTSHTTTKRNQKSKHDT